MAADHDLVFLRHGETEWNVAGRLQGQRDVPINATGRRQARHNGAAVKAAIPEIADYDFVSSPLVRACESMELARLAMGLDPSLYHRDDRLKEISFGEWEGYTPDQIRTLDPSIRAARERDKWEFVPPGGESYRLLAARVAQWLAGIAVPTVVVSHGGVGRVLHALVLGKAPHEAVTMSFPQDQVLRIRGCDAAWL